MWEDQEFADFERKKQLLLSIDSCHVIVDPDHRTKKLLDALVGDGLIRGLSPSYTWDGVLSVEISLSAKGDKAVESIKGENMKEDLLSPELVHAIIRIAQQKAYERGESAAFNGEYHDGGKSVTLEGCRVLSSLWDRKPLPRASLPEVLVEFIPEAEKSLDPEYSTYLRLKNKFR